MDLPVTVQAARMILGTGQKKIGVILPRMTTDPNAGARGLSCIKET
jgi:hypothetical protein